MFINSFFFKTKCCNCNRDCKFGICISCTNQIQRIPSLHCKVCKSLSIENDICIECDKRLPLFINLSTIGIYNGLIKTLIYDYKYQKIKSHAKPLSYLLSESIKKEINYKNISFITSIPLSEEKIKSRGFNQAYLLSKELSNILKIPYKEIFSRIKDTKPQFSLSYEERKDNLKDAFTLSYTNIKDKKILIVDDIFTTGTTIQEVCKLLIPYTKEIYVATLARSIL